jgi:predicted HTH transcriptional regulator
MKGKKGLMEEFSKFLENPNRQTLLDLFKFNTGEYNHLDFKKEHLDDEKLIKHILAFGNFGGGILIFGVEEKEDGSFDTEGILEFKKKEDIESKLKNYLPSELSYEILNFDFSDWESPKIKDKKFQVILIEDTPQYLPFMAKKEIGSIRLFDIFTRKNKKSEIVDYDSLSKIINRKIESGFSTNKENYLIKNLSELRRIYEIFPKQKHFLDFFQNPLYKDNPKYPSEDFEDFLLKLIKIKKEKIERILSE